MMNKKRNKKKIYVIFIITFILIILLCFSYSNKRLIKIHKFFYNIGIKIEDKLVKKELNNEIILGINKSLEEENTELKQLLGLKEDKYDIITANVIKRDNWYNSITISKGKKDKLTKNMAVLDSNGLIGKIIEVGENYSVVGLITSNLNISKVAVDIINDNNYHGILDSYDNGYLIIKNIDKEANIEKGNKIYTNGLGGIYPNGIYIGEVEKIENDSLELSKIVKVKLNNNFNNIRYVNIIRR